MYTFHSASRSGENLYITDRELKHLRVRRIRPGEEIGVIYGDTLYRCRLESLDRKRAVCRIIEEVDVKKPKVRVFLLQSVLHEMRVMDFIVQKATEIGVERLVLLITERSFQSLEAIEKRIERWNRIVNEAMKQANRPYRLSICGPVHVGDLEPEGDLRVVLNRSERAVSLGNLSPKEGEVCSIAIGPEGGFTDRDIEVLRRKGFIESRIDTFIMRSETAAIVAAGFMVARGGF